MQNTGEDSVASVFRKRHRWHIARVYLKLGLLILGTGALAVVTVSAHFQSNRGAYIAALFVGAFLYVLILGTLGSRDVFRVRLLPYFSKRLGDTDTWLTGQSLFRHSRQLDELATKLHILPISAFASGDDLILGEKLQWFDPKPAHETVSQILASPDATSFPDELKSDLQALRAALASASSKNVQFCLLLREGSSTSGAEMDQRKGSFF